VVRQGGEAAAGSARGEEGSEARRRRSLVGRSCMGKERSRGRRVSRGEEEESGSRTPPIA
jgi:hypothetical protein